MAERTAITAKAQAGRSTIAGLLSVLIGKLAMQHPLTAGLSTEISLVSFYTLTQLGMVARDRVLPKLFQWLG